MCDNFIFRNAVLTLLSSNWTNTTICPIACTGWRKRVKWKLWILCMKIIKSIYIVTVKQPLSSSWSLKFLKIIKCNYILKHVIVHDNYNKVKPHQVCVCVCVCQTVSDGILKVSYQFYMAISRSDYKSACWWSIEAAWKNMNTHHDKEVLKSVYHC